MKTGTIVLVEDNADDVALTRDALEQSKIANRLVVLRDGAAALEYLLNPARATAAEGERPAVVLLDIKLPKIDGLEVLRLIRQDPATRRIPVVVLTSSKEQQDLIASYELGANSYIRKPVDFDQFVAAVKQLGLYWLLLNEPSPVLSRP